MCGIAGFFNYEQKFNYMSDKKCKKVLLDMINTLNHRGNDDKGIYIDSTNNVSSNLGLAHTRLSIIDLENGHQPMTKSLYGNKYTIIYNGEVYNQYELRNDLISKGYIFETKSDTEILLNGYIEYGESFVEKVNGIFAFAIFDKYKNQLNIFRDRIGVKPVFYTNFNGTFIFSSEIKAILKYPNVYPIIDINGLNEIFSLGPARTCGCGVFKGINEILPAHFITVNSNGLKEQCYWKLISRNHTDNYNETVERVSFLIKDSIKRQMISDVPICTFLSGGIDSSIVSSICALELRKQGKRIDTYSFDFYNNEKYFKSSFFQPEQDKPYVKKMVKFLNSNHRFLECKIINQVELLTKSVDAHDLPCMADIDSSMLYFCSIVKENHKVVLTGECADEIFGGYPWFYNNKYLNLDTFPWAVNLETRKAFLLDSFLDELDMENYILNAYNNSIMEIPKFKYDSNEDIKHRKISYLNIKWFMQTLLNRMDRTSMYSGLEARVPFADYRIIEYLWNVPWHMKFKNNIVKGLLRDASVNFLPCDILYRKKSPYPKSYDDVYRKMLVERIESIIFSKSSKVLQFLDVNKTRNFINNIYKYDLPWYGQLMCANQMLAYIIQIDYWLKKYDVIIKL